jgi:DNA mismatch repair protein MutS
MSLIDEYFDYQIKYENKYGKNNTLVLMEIGSFYEFYGIDNEIEKIGNVKKVAELLNIQQTRRNKSILGNSRKNPQLAGFPSPSLHRYLQLLISNKYNVILVEQTTNPPYPKREVTKIYSPGTYIDELSNSNSNNILSLFITKEKDIKTSLNYIYISSFSVMDMSTGIGLFYETHSIDIGVLMEEIFRFIETHTPSEILYYHKNITKNELKTFSKIQKLPNVIEINNKLIKLSYQNEFLKNIYKNTKLLTPIEYLNLETYPNVIISFILLLEYVEEHDSQIIKNIEIPEFWKHQKHLTLHNNTINQLDVSEKLFDIINKTKTPMGKRLLKYNLLNPIVSSKKLNKIYNEIEEHKDIKELEDICDIERLHRKLSLGRLQPTELYNLFLSYDSILVILGIPFDDLFVEYYGECKRIFNEKEISKCNLKKIEKSFFNLGVFENIDNIENEIKINISKLEKISNKLSNIISDNSNSKSNKIKDLEKINMFVKVKHTEKSGYYLETTNTRSKILKKNLFVKNEKKNENIYEFKQQTNIVKITSKKIKKYNNNLLKLKRDLEIECKEKYLEILLKLDDKYHKTLIAINKKISHLDFINSCSLVSKSYGYVKPEIIDSENSYIDAILMRHPIIERVNEDINYVPNDVLLNGTGMLLYGLNGSGKSSYMKSIGLNVILAQMGMYVPCKTFKYTPFKNIYTRIQNNDNMSIGHSSFDVEMHELRPILKYSDKNSLILGDELCRGTEDLSALSIFAATITILCSKGLNFVFATHLHKLEKLVKHEENLKICHISVEIDKKNNILIYNRKLKEGRGTSLYGLEVARHIINDNDFIKLAQKFRDGLINKIELEKTSKYNNKLYVTKCQIPTCDNIETPYDTHHIKFQSKCNDNGLFEHIQKNSKSNLVVLCKKCHNDVHNDKIIINGYKETSDGVFLDYKINVDIKKKKVESRKKFDEEKIKIIMEYNEDNINLKYVKNELKKKDIRISTGTLKKIFDNKY